MAKRRPSSSNKRPSASRKQPAVKAFETGGEMRLNKILASAGLGSRREVEELIVQGRVEVGREIVTDLACKLDPSQVTIKVDGQALKRFRPVYFMLNKPKGVLSTNHDPSGRMRVIDFVPENERVFSVGRLDKNSEGLMLLTNDGALAQRLAHPKYRVQKTYFVVVAGSMTREELAKLRKGVYLAEGFARIDGATIRKQRKNSTELEIVLSEGKNREIRRILARAGHKVLTLRRIAIATLRLGQLPVGAARLLKPAEIQSLYTVAASPNTRKSAKPSPSGRKKSVRNSSTESSSQKKSSKSPRSGGKASSDNPIGDSHDDDLASLEYEQPWLPEDSFDSDADLSGLGTDGSVLAYDDGDAETEWPVPESQTASSPRGKRGESRRKTAANKNPRGKAPSGGRTKTAGKTKGKKRPSSKKTPARPAARGGKSGGHSSQSAGRSGKSPRTSSRGGGGKSKPASAAKRRTKRR